MPSPFWGKRAGAYYCNDKPKGHSTVWGWIIKLKRGSTTGGSSSTPKRKTIWKLLAENARARRGRGH